MKKINFKIIIIVFCILLIILIGVLVNKYMGGFIFGGDSTNEHNLKNYTHIISNINNSEENIKITNVYTFENDNCISIRTVYTFDSEEKAKEEYDKLSSVENLSIKENTVSYNRAETYKKTKESIISELENYDKNSTNYIIY